MNVTHHVEGHLWQVIILASQDVFEAGHGVLQLHILACSSSAGESLASTLFRLTARSLTHEQGTGTELSADPTALVLSCLPADAHCQNATRTCFRHVPVFCLF